MITKFKLYETLNQTPQKGDYVICKLILEPDIDPKTIKNYKELQKFLENSMGQIQSEMLDPNGINNQFAVQYDTRSVSINLQNSIEDFARCVNEEEILYCSHNIKDIEEILDAKKFGI